MRWQLWHCTSARWSVVARFVSQSALLVSDSASCWQEPFAPRPLRRFVATTAPSDSRPSRPTRYAFRVDAVGHDPRSPGLSGSSPCCPNAPPHSTPGSRVTTGLCVDRLALIRSPPVQASPNPAGWPLPSLRFEASTMGSLALRLAPSRREAPTRRLLDHAARIATCVTGSSHGEHLAAHETG